MRTRTRLLLWPAAAALALTALAPEPAQAQTNACMEATQGKIAWDYKGTKRWAQGNLDRLCRNASSIEPAKCFRRVMHGGINWGGGTQWQWQNAIDLCEQSTDANRTVACFEGKKAQGWQNAIAQCDERAPPPPPVQQLSACEAAVQDRVAWDYKGNKRWAQGNLDRLCRNATNAEPAACFEKVMHGGINWGGGTQWQWQNAIDLCEQSPNAARTVACFQRNASKGWQQAIAACDERAPQLSACEAALQDRVAWDYKGNTRWAQGNLDRLCGGGDSAEPATCFNRIMHGNISWGSSTQWQWQNAIDLCERSTNAGWTVGCFQSKIHTGWQNAIRLCDERATHADCRGAAQGRIAWDYKNNTRWAQGNLDRLCRNAVDDEPAKCFQKVMHGGINWGGGTQWQWQNAIDLCEQSADGERTVSCFVAALRKAGGWQGAIAACDERAR